MTDKITEIFFYAMNLFDSTDSQSNDESDSLKIVNIDKF